MHTEAELLTSVLNPTFVSSQVAAMLSSQVSIEYSLMINVLFSDFLCVEGCLFAKSVIQLKGKIYLHTFNIFRGRIFSVHFFRFN